MRQVRHGQQKEEMPRLRMYGIQQTLEDGMASCFYTGTEKKNMEG